MSVSRICSHGYKGEFGDKKALIIDSEAKPYANLKEEEAYMCAT